MAHVPHVMQAAEDTIEIYAIARAHLEKQGITDAHEHFGPLMRAFMATFCEAVKWRSWPENTETPNS